MNAMDFFNPYNTLLALVMLLTGGVRDLAHCISTDAYWKTKSVAVTFDAMTHELQAVHPADISKLIADLEADDPRDRTAAAERIAAIGPAAAPALEAAARDGSPEVATRANVLIARIRAASKAGSVRRLMAIRTLGAMKDSRALPVLKPLLESREMFEPDYARAAIAKIQGQNWSMPAASAADRAADVALLPARLDAVAQVAPAYDAELFFDRMFDAIPMDPDQKAKARDEQIGQIVNILDTVGNIRLDAVTWGFYAAPPGVPGNSILIARGQFDVTAACEMLGKSAGATRKLDSLNVFMMNDDTALVITPDQRVMLLARESNGDLALDAMAENFKHGAGDFAANPDLPPLVKSIDQKAPFWAATKISPGMKEVADKWGLADFETATMQATQTQDAAGAVQTAMRLDARTIDQGKARHAAEVGRAVVAAALARVQAQVQGLPIFKPAEQLLESVKIDCHEGAAAARGSLNDIGLLQLRDGGFLSDQGK